MTAQDGDGMDATIMDKILRELPAAMETALGGVPHITLGTPAIVAHNLGWAGRLLSGTPDPLRAGAVSPPAVDQMDVTWPDGTFKVFPDRTERTFAMDVLEVAPETASMWARIVEEVRAHQLEGSILAELSAIITERGTDAPGLLIIRTPSGEWAMRESEWLAPGSAMLARLDQPDLMAVAQGDGWLYYRQGPPTV